jgi:hypothetical protein
MISTSQTAQKLSTLLGQMRDEARAERIKGLRERTPGLTQPKIVEGLEALAGRAVVTLRGYQEWERTGGIKYENAELLASFHGVDPHWLWQGETTAGTPSLVETLNGNGPREVDVEVLQRLERLERMVQQVLDRLPEPVRPSEADDEDLPAALEPSPQPSEQDHRTGRRDQSRGV